MILRPHQGNIKRDVKIFVLYDSGEHSPKEIAALITMQGYHCTTKIVRHALKRRERYPGFYVETLRHFAALCGVEIKTFNR